MACEREGISDTTFGGCWIQAHGDRGDVIVWRVIVHTRERVADMRGNYLFG
jgi:hypothetical protein